MPLQTLENIFTTKIFYISSKVFLNRAAFVESIYLCNTELFYINEIKVTRFHGHSNPEQIQA